VDHAFGSDLEPETSQHKVQWLQGGFGTDIILKLSVTEGRVRNLVLASQHMSHSQLHQRFFDGAEDSQYSDYAHCKILRLGILH
jgi:hypothetical protein